MARAIPESSLNRLLISPLCPLEEYRRQKGTDLLHSTAINQIKTDMGKLWTVEVARRLAALIYSLLGDRPQWPQENKMPKAIQQSLEGIRLYWAQCTQILLGGGYLSGTVGPKILEKTVSFLRCWDIAEERIALSAFPENLPLHGAAQHQPLESLVLDFGHGSVKGLWQGSLLPPFPMELNSKKEGTDPAFSEEVLRKIQAALAYYSQQINPAAPSKLVVSIAAYVHEGHFIPTLPSGPKLVKITPGSKKAGFCGQIIPKTSQFKEDFGKFGTNPGPLRLFYKLRITA
jgi:hypothetical protein